MHTYDLIVIGGGSGGLACANRAGKLGKRVALCNFVEASKHGTTWGLGGTCLNVGCIPKIIMHRASQFYENNVSAAEGFGCIPGSSHPNWEILTQNIQSYTKKQSFACSAELVTNGVTYFNAWAAFVDKHTVAAKNAKNETILLTGSTIVIATGGRPRYADIPGAHYAITSDDIFSLSHPPGKTLVVGGSYIALECASFLQGLGFATTVMHRGVLLRHFDRQMVEVVRLEMQRGGVRFIENKEVTRIVQTESEKLVASWDGGSETFDTILFAVGRDPCTSGLNLSAAGVTVSSDGTIPTSREQTNVDHIYAIGDVIDGTGISRNTTLTPVAVQSGVFLANRLFAGDTVEMDYGAIPTALYTTTEYACVGLTEEEAIRDYGQTRIQVYESTSYAPDDMAQTRECKAKILCVKDDLRVVGLHYSGPNAGDVMQGFALAMKCGLTKSQMDSAVGIHPTIAELFVCRMEARKIDEIVVRKRGC